MTTYNASETIVECLDSILNQTFSDFELLIVDDGSTDNTVNIISSYNDVRMKLIKNSHNYIGSLNLLLETAKGKYLAKMDADDVMLPNRLEIQYNYMECHPFVDILSCGIQCFGMSKNKYVPKACERLGLEQFVNSNPIVHPSVMMRCSSMRSNNLKYDQAYIYAEDYHLWIEAIKMGLCIATIEEIVLRYRVSTKQISSQHRTELEYVTRRIQKELTYWLVKGEVEWSIAEPYNLPKTSNLLTVIIPFLNEGNEVKKTILEIKRTTGNKVDIVAINDCSYDSYPYGKELAGIENVHYILNKERKGVAASRDFGVRICQTPYFILLDAHMRFYDSLWYQQIIKELLVNDRQLLCCQTKFLYKIPNTDDIEVLQGCPQTFGAYSPFAKNQIWPDIDWNQKEQNPGDIIEEIPTVLGAGYATSKRYWIYLKGLQGLRNYGSDESYISFKVWLEGGKCVLLKNVCIGHIYRNHAPYQILINDSVFNQLLIAKLLFPQSVYCETLTSALVRNKEQVRLFGDYLNEKENEIQSLKEYYQSIFHSKIEDVFYRHSKCHVEANSSSIKKVVDCLPDIFRLISEHTFTSNSIFDGNAAAVVWLCHYSNFANDSYSDELAASMWKRVEQYVYEHQCPWGFKYGLSGIGWCALYLWFNDFIDEYPIGLLKCIDSQLKLIDPIMSDDMSFDTGLSGVLAYLCLKLRGGDISWSTALLEKWHNIALQIIAKGDSGRVSTYYAILFVIMCKYGYDKMDFKPMLEHWINYSFFIPRNRKYWDLSLDKGILGTSIAAMNLSKKFKI